VCLHNPNDSSSAGSILALQTQKSYRFVEGTTYRC